MNNYKFRGKRKDNGEWVYGDLWRNLTNPEKPLYKISYWIMEEVNEEGVNVNHEVDVIPETVGIWTGLKDKNGKEIYDGDILKSFSPSVPSYEVFYDRSSYRLRYKLKNGEWYDWGPLFRMEEIQWEGRLPLCPDVIGNIHDHPHLLNPAKGAVTHTMNNDPNLKAASEQEAAGQADVTTEQATEGQTAALESEEQDQAVGADAEEGSVEG